MKCTEAIFIALVTSCTTSSIWASRLRGVKAKGLFHTEYIMAFEEDYAPIKRVQQSQQSQHVRVRRGLKGDDGTSSLSCTKSGKFDGQYNINCNTCGDKCLTYLASTTTGGTASSPTTSLPTTTITTSLKCTKSGKYDGEYNIDCDSCGSKCQNYLASVTTLGTVVSSPFTTLPTTTTTTTIKCTKSQKNNIFCQPDYQTTSTVLATNPTTVTVADTTTPVATVPTSTGTSTTTAATEASTTTAAATETSTTTAATETSTTTAATETSTTTVATETSTTTTATDPITLDIKTAALNTAAESCSPQEVTDPELCRAWLLAHNDRRYDYHLGLGTIENKRLNPGPNANKASLLTWNQTMADEAKVYADYLAGRGTDLTHASLDARFGLVRIWRLVLLEIPRKKTC